MSPAPSTALAAASDVNGCADVPFAPLEEAELSTYQTRGPILNVTVPVLDKLSVSVTV